MNLTVEITPGLKLRNPVMTASGTYGYGLEYDGLAEVTRFGAIVSKGTTLKPKDGNPQPRITETPDGILNAIGLENIGVEALIRDIAPRWAKLDVPAIVNIAGETVSDYADVAARLNGVPGVAALEVNISCPNVELGGMVFGTDPRIAAGLVRGVRAATDLPLLVKLTPNVTDIAGLARAVEEAGADALTVINTLKGLAIDAHTRRAVLGNTSGGLSGPAVKPVALYAVYDVSRAVKIPVIGCGGIVSGEDAVEFMLAGARAVQVGSAAMKDPAAPLKVIDGITEYLRTADVEDVNDLVGALKS
jgi:dihydroorotate dehydrogenase (NAD+) catalytic subunit